MRNRIEYKNNYREQHYDRIELSVPKGEKARIKGIAESLDISVNEYIYTLICKDIATGKSQLQKHKGMTDEQIRQLDRWQIPAKYRDMIETFLG